LSSIIGVTPALAAWTVYIDGDRLRFSDQSERSAVNLLMTALRQPSWNDYQKRAGVVMNDSKAKFEQAKGAHANAQHEITDTAESLQQAKDDLKAEDERLAEEAKALKSEAKKVSDSITTNDEAITKLQARQKEIKSILKKLEDDNAQAYHNLEREKAGISTKVSQHQIKRTALVEGRADIKAKLRTESDYLKEMQSEPETCPTCNKKWDKTHGAKELKEQADRVKNLTEKLTENSSRIDNVDESVSGLNTEINEVENRIRALRAPQRNQTLSHEYEDNDNAIGERTANNTTLKLRLQLLQQGPDKSEANRLKAIVQERQTAATEAKDALKDAAEGMVQAEALVKVTSYWYEAFGPTGIPNMILTEAIKPLNEIARRISLLMTGGTLDINYGTSRELASGDSSAELVINVKNKIGSQRAEGSSKGESGLTNLIIAETLSEVGSVSNRIGYRWYDEILNSQDQVVRRSILSYLRDLANRLGILVFVVDHHHEAASYADYVLVAEKTDKGTDLYWR
jgi:DNA repair exonuclease SbcCD ATPase subunit